jgi:Flp pilus assembly secretin CpaC
MRRMILACLVLGCCQIAFGQEVAPQPSPFPVSPYRRMATPAPPGDRLHHLLEAAEHLDAAGLEEEAAGLRQLAEQEKQAIIERLGALEAEVERLRQLLGEPQVLVKVKMVEISRGKLRKLGIDFATPDTGPIEFGYVIPTGARPFAFGVVDDGDAVLGVLEALQEDRLARVLAEPMLVTLSGRPAHCHVGGEIPAPVPQEDGTVAVEFREYGTRIDLVPIVLGGGRIRLEVRVRVGEIDPSRSVEVQGQTCPGLKVREVDTGVEMAPGQTLILSGLVEKRVAEPAERTAQAGEADAVEEEVELLVLVRPEIVDPFKPRLSRKRRDQPVSGGAHAVQATRPVRPSEGKTTR